MPYSLEKNESDLRQLKVKLYEITKEIGPLHPLSDSIHELKINLLIEYVENMHKMLKYLSDLGKDQLHEVREMLEKNLSLERKVSKDTAKLKSSLPSAANIIDEIVDSYEQTKKYLLDQINNNLKSEFVSSISYSLSKSESDLKQLEVKLYEIAKRVGPLHPLNSSIRDFKIAALIDSVGNMHSMLKYFFDLEKDELYEAREILEKDIFLDKELIIGNAVELKSILPSAAKIIDEVVYSYNQTKQHLLDRINHKLNIEKLLTNHTQTTPPLEQGNMTKERFKQNLEEKLTELQQKSIGGARAILGVAHDTSDSNIKKAYNKIIVKWGHDKSMAGYPGEHKGAEFEHTQKVAEEIFKIINEAYVTLSKKEEKSSTSLADILRALEEKLKEDDVEMLSAFLITNEKLFYIKSLPTVFNIIAEKNPKLFDAAIKAIEHLRKYKPDDELKKFNENVTSLLISSEKIPAPGQPLFGRLLASKCDPRVIARCFEEMYKAVDRKDPNYEDPWVRLKRIEEYPEKEEIDHDKGYYCDCFLRLYEKALMAGVIKFQEIVACRDRIIEKFSLDEILKHPEVENNHIFYELAYQARLDKANKKDQYNIFSELLNNIKTKINDQNLQPKEISNLKEVLGKINDLAEDKLSPKEYNKLWKEYEQDFFGSEEQIIKFKMELMYLMMIFPKIVKDLLKDMPATERIKIIGASFSVLVPYNITDYLNTYLNDKSFVPPGSRWDVLKEITDYCIKVMNRFESDSVKDQFNHIQMKALRDMKNKILPEHIKTIPSDSKNIVRDTAIIKLKAMANNESDIEKLEAEYEKFLNRDKGYAEKSMFVQLLEDEPGSDPRIRQLKNQARTAYSDKPEEFNNSYKNYTNDLKNQGQFICIIDQATLVKVESHLSKVKTGKMAKDIRGFFYDLARRNEIDLTPEEVKFKKDITIEVVPRKKEMGKLYINGEHNGLRAEFKVAETETRVEEEGTEIEIEEEEQKEKKDNRENEKKKETEESETETRIRAEVEEKKRQEEEAKKQATIEVEKRKTIGNKEKKEEIKKSVVKINAETEEKKPIAIDLAKKESEIENKTENKYQEEECKKQTAIKAEKNSEVVEEKERVKSEQKECQEKEAKKEEEKAENDIEIEHESDEDLGGDAEFDTTRIIQRCPIPIEPGDYCQRIEGRPVALVHIFEGKGGDKNNELIKKAKGWLRTKMTASKLPEDTALKSMPSMPEEALFSPDQIRASVYFVSLEEHKDLNDTLGNKPEFQIEEKNQIQKYGIIESNSNNKREVKFKIISSSEDVEKLKVPGNFVNELYEVTKRFEEMVERKGRLKELKLGFIPSTEELNVRQKAMLAYCINKGITVKDKSAKIVSVEEIFKQDLTRSSSFQDFYNKSLKGKNLENLIIKAAKASLKKGKEEKPMLSSFHAGPTAP